MEEKDIWSNFADMLGNLIAKYYDVLDIDSLPEPPKINRETEKQDKYS